MNEMQLRWNKVFSGLMIFGGLFILGTSFVVGFSLNTVTGVVVLVVGGLSWTNPTIVITADEMQIRNLLGMTLKRFPTKEIRARDNALYHHEKKITGLWFTDTKGEDVERFLSDLQGG